MTDDRTTPNPTDPTYPIEVPELSEFDEVVWRVTDEPLAAQTGVSGGLILFPHGPEERDFSLNFDGVIRVLNQTLGRYGIKFERDGFSEYSIRFTVQGQPLTGEQWQRTVTTGGKMIRALYGEASGLTLISRDSDKALCLVEFKAVDRSHLAIVVNGDIVVGELRDRLGFFLEYKVAIGDVVAWGPHGLVLGIGDSAGNRNKAALVVTDVRPFLNELFEELFGSTTSVVYLSDFRVYDDELAQESGFGGMHVHPIHLIMGGGNPDAATWSPPEG